MRGGLTVPPNRQTIDVEVEVKLDFAPFIEACRLVAAQFQAFADALSAAFPGPHIPGLQRLAEASDLTVAARHGEVRCAGVHDALPPGGCHFCGAVL
jgi:hypothetical protein